MNIAAELKPFVSPLVSSDDRMDAKRSLLMGLSFLMRMAGVGILVSETEGDE